MIVEKFISWLALLSGLTISAVAIYYSVSGLVNIFAAAVVPIVVMGIVLEISKLVATVWLKRYWRIAPWSIKSYLITAVLALMLITSIGIYGYLARAHLDQKLPANDISDKVELIDSKISDKMVELEESKKSLTQLNAAVDETMNRSTSDTGAFRSIKVRQAQQVERDQIRSNIDRLQLSIDKLKEDKAPLQQQIRKSEVEFGPITYIAALIYNDSTNENNLESAVRYVIILIVLVFDPLAVTLLLASQYSFKYIEEEYAPRMPIKAPQTPVVEDEVKTDTNTSLHEFEDEIDDIEDAHNMIEWDTNVPESEDEYNEREAKTRWKASNRSDTIKHQEKLHSLGLIDQLPWEKS